MKSIRNQMVLFVLGSGGLLVTTGALVTQLRTESLLLDGFDAALESKVRVLATLTSVNPEEPLGIELDFGDEFMPEFERLQAPSYFQLRLANGRTIERSNSLGLGDLPLQDVLTEIPIKQDVTLPDGRLGRLVQLEFIPQNEGPAFGAWLSDSDERVVAGTIGQAENFAERFPLAGVTLVVAQGRESLDDDIWFMRMNTLVVSLGMMLGLGLVLLWAGHLVSRPVLRIGEELKGIDPKHLTTRISLGDCPAELAPLVEQLNLLLARFEKGLIRERRFSSDVAHELRSPVTRLRLIAEVASMGDDLTEEQVEFFQDLDNSAKKLESVVQGLLLISRAETSGGANPSELTPMAPLIRSAIRDIEIPMAKMPLKLVGDEDTEWCINPGQINIALRNLVGNAIDHGLDSEPIRVTWDTVNGVGVLQVSNAVEGLDQEELEHLFDRFWRKDKSRPADGHFGLGLSIVRAICDLENWKVTAELSPSGQVLTISIRDIPLN